MVVFVFCGIWARIDVHLVRGCSSRKNERGHKTIDLPCICWFLLCLQFRQGIELCSRDGLVGMGLRRNLGGSAPQKKITMTWIYIKQILNMIDVDFNFKVWRVGSLFPSETGVGSLLPVDFPRRDWSSVLLDSGLTSLSSVSDCTKNTILTKIIRYIDYKPRTVNQPGCVFRPSRQRSPDMLMEGFLISRSSHGL